MGSIRQLNHKDGSTTYHAEVRLKGYQTQRATFRTKTKAKQWIQTTEANMRDGRYVNVTESRRRTLNDLINRYIEVWLTKYPPRLPKQKALLSWWADKYGFKFLCDITPALIAEGRDKLLSETTYRKSLRSPSTVNRYLCALGKALTVAVKEWGWIEDTPMRKVTKLKEGQGRDRFLSLEERDRLLTACQESRNPLLHDLVSLSLLTGARYSELALLKWEDIDFETKRLVFRRTKNGDDRYIPLSEEVEVIFKRLKILKSIEIERVFTPFGNRRNKDRKLSVRGAFKKALEMAGIKNFRWHDLRHTAASYMAMNGATQAELQAILGHRSVVASARYRHFSQEHLRQVISKNTLLTWKKN